jgi:hypothetical protein
MSGNMCRHLRTKSDYYAKPAEEDNPVPEYGRRLYWCQQTMDWLGPDDEPSGCDVCVAGRGCYEGLPVPA